ncbi:MAG: arginyltransferase [Lentisphaeraceae bacterium]|nr:arginyltransferase [Lentisphaeraceae bacterium]
MHLDQTKIDNDYIEAECAYIKGLTALTQYNIVPKPSPELAEDYLNKGWRRFGKMFFRPQCAGCSRCVPLRVKPAEFTLSKNMRKIIKKNQDLIIETGPPKCTSAHLALHNLYHRYKSEQRNWPLHEINTVEYHMLFCEPIPFTKEIRYLSPQEELIGVAYVDILPNNYSSLYFFHHPEWKDRNLGTFSILKEIEHAREMDLEYYHLGYYVQGCSSMSYKLRFSPYSLLKGHSEVWNWNDATWQ